MEKNKMKGIWEDDDDEVKRSWGKGLHSLVCKQTNEFKFTYRQWIEGTEIFVLNRSSKLTNFWFHED
jgi:hypothetical protein